MTDYTRHLGEIMGQSPAERDAAAQAAQDEAAWAANHPAAAPDATSAQGASDAGSQIANGPAPIDVVGHGAAEHATAIGHAASHAAQHGPDLSAYAFPFSAREVFGLLPDSIGGKVESLWQYAQNFSDQTPSVTMVVTSIVLFAILVAFISTVRVWRRGTEVAVAGFGDHLTRVGTRYTVRQDAPRLARGKQPAAKTLGPASEPLIVPPAEDLATAALAPETASLVATRGAEPAAKGARKPVKGWGRFGKAEASAKSEPRKPILLKKKADPKAAAAAKAERKPIPINRKGDNAKAARPNRAAPLAAAGAAIPAADTGPAAKAEEKKPKTVRRQLFRREATAHSFAGRLHGTFGSYEPQDRLFAADYLKQTNEAFEAAHLKGKGPHFPALRLGDNHRAERLFMMAARTAGEDPSTALAALWQAVEEDSADAVAWLRLAHCYLELGKADRAARILEPLQAQAEKSNLPVIVAAAANSRGKIAAQKGDAEGARKLLSGALTAAEASKNPFLIGVAACNLGLVEAARGKLQPARDHLAKGIKSLEVCEENASAARFGMALGTVLRGLGDPKAAENVWTESSHVLRTAKLDDEAEAVDRWLNGEAPPSKVTL